MFCDFATAGAEAGRTAAVRPLAGEGMIGGAMCPLGDVFTAGSLTVRRHNGNPGVAARRALAVPRDRNLPGRHTLLCRRTHMRPPGSEDENR